ncbi:hypothetical protein BDR07DRAFT_1606055 [Suillus spraguei]|nr:hypothetical protein BDR07DRAFT_1606055 [Suillus spraguei]
MVRSPKKRQLRPKPAPYKRKPKTPSQKNEEVTTRRRIIGAPLTVDEILDPQEEKNVGEPTAYEEDDAIVAEIQRRQAIRSGELVEVESDDEDEDDPPN